MNKKKDKTEKGKPGRPRNPFAGRPHGGAGPHTEKKYGKKNRRRLKEEIEKQREEDAGEK